MASLVATGALFHWTFGSGEEGSGVTSRTFLRGKERLELASLQNL